MGLARARKGGETASDFEERFAGDDTSSVAIREMLISNGLLHTDGSVDLAMLEALGWSVADGGEAVAVTH